MGQYGGGGGTAKGSYVPLEITSGVDFGYDDNVIGSNAAANSNGQGSFFAKENLVLTYHRPGEETEVSLLAVGRFTQYVDLSTDDKDVNLTATLTHKFTTRLSFRADIYAAYQTEPNFQSNIGPTNVRAPHFDTTDTLSLTYYWFSRFSTVTSYTFERVKYLSSSTTTTAVGTTQDRFQNTLAESLQFSLTTRTILTGEYRFEVIDYDNDPARDATIHFALAGVDHHLTQHLSIKVLAGPSFRSFKNDGNTIDPYAELRVTYEGGNHSLNWLTTYGVEQPSGAVALGSTTLRTGLNLTYNLTSRTDLRAGVYFNDEQNQTGTTGTIGNTSTGSQEALQFTLSLKYTINKHFGLHADYEYTIQNSSGGTSSGGTPGYSRNRYFAGVTYKY